MAFVRLAGAKLPEPRLEAMSFTPDCCDC